MLTSLSTETFAAISIGLVIGLIILLVLQIITGLRVQRLTYPIYEFARSQSQAEADRIVNAAREEARRMLVEAQSTVESLVGKQREDIEARAQAYQKALEDLSNAAQHAMSENTEKARTIQAEAVQKIAHDIEAQGQDLRARTEVMGQQLEAFLKQSQTQTADIHRALDEKSREITDGLKRTFDDVSATGKKAIDERINALLQAAETEVNTYRDARKRMVDEHMADLVTETSKVVLGKALAPDEHADLVERALKEARSTGMI